MAGPRLDDSKVHQRDCAQLSVHPDQVARPICCRSIEQIYLLDYFRELAAAPCERQLQGRMCYREAAAAGRRCAHHVGFSRRQLSRCLLQPSLRKLRRCVSQSQLWVLSRCPGRKRPQQRGDAAFLTVERQAEQVVREEPGRIWPIAGRERVSNGRDDLTVITEPRCGLAVEVRNFLTERSAKLQAQEVR